MLYQVELTQRVIARFKVTLEADSLDAAEALARERIEATDVVPDQIDDTIETVDVTVVTP